MTKRAWDQTQNRRIAMGRPFVSFNLQWVSYTFLLLLFIASDFAFAKTVRYELVATRESVNLSGKKSVDFAITMNGQIPAPTLEFTEGDIAEIHVTNRVAGEELSVHWHGILLPPEMDGVPYVTTPPIRTGESYTFRFPLRQHGTYWYHSHTATQEQKGVYGALIIHPKTKKSVHDHEAVVVISDWTDENPDRVIKNLRKDGEYYAYKKGTVRSYWGAIRAGGLSTQLTNEWSRMGGMDLSDVGYDAFLINGRRESQLMTAHPGETVLLRLINASASSYFHVSLGQTPMHVIAADGVNIVPINADQILMGTAETYDVLFTVPEHKNYELRATAQDGTGFASAWIGMGDPVHAPDRPAPNLYAPMGHGSGHGQHENHKRKNSIHDERSYHDHHQQSQHQGHPESAERSIETLSVEHLKSPEATMFSNSAPVREFRFALGGDMERYVWTINGKTIDQERTITVEANQVIRFIFENETMMHHPFHLHGHFFRVINDNGEHSPLKHTVDIPPHGRRVIEFYTNEPGDWMLHCHNLYHFKTGMARVVSYASFQPSPEIQKLQHHDPHLMDHIYPAYMLEAASGHAQAEARFSRSWDAVDLRFETREYENLDHAEGDALYRRWFTQYFIVFAGGSLYSGYEQDPTRAVIGVGYTLPLLLETEIFLDHTGDLRLDLERRFQWTSNVFTDSELSFRQNEKTEFEVTLMYGPSWTWAAGLMLTEEDLGFGLQVRF